MKFRFFLICRKCGKSAYKDFDKSEQEIKNLIKIAKYALRLPQYLVHPDCFGIMSVDIEVHKINK